MSLKKGFLHSVRSLPELISGSTPAATPTGACRTAGYTFGIRQHGSGVTEFGRINFGRLTKNVNPSNRHSSRTSLDQTTPKRNTHL